MKASGRLLSLILAFLLLFSVVTVSPIAVSAAEYYDGLAGDCNWSFDAPLETLTISGYGSMPDYSSADSPWYNLKEDIKTIKIQYGVTNIGKYAFSDCENLTSVEIPDSVTKIGDCAFKNCQNLICLTIPETVTEIGSFIFSSLSDNLSPNPYFYISGYINSAAYTYAESRNIPFKEITDSVLKKANTMIVKTENKTIEGKKLDKKNISVKAITVQNAKGKITYKKISGNDKITVNQRGSITVKKGTLSGLYRITIQITAAGTSSYKPKTITVTVKIKITKKPTNNTIEETEKEKIYKGFKYDILKNGNVRIIKYKGKASSVTIPKTINKRKVTTLGVYSGYGDEGRGFTDTKVKNVTIPKYVSKIINKADTYGIYGHASGDPGVNDQFSFSNLKKINVVKSNKYFSSKKGVLYNKKQTKLIAFPTKYSKSNFKVPKTVTKIDNAAFGGSSIKKITFNKKLKTIGKMAFAYCEKLKSVKLPEKLKKIELGGFSFCKSLKNVKFNSKIKTIEDWAFAGTKLGKSLVLPNSTTSIGECAFFWCGNLKSVTLPKKVKTIGPGAFSECKKLKKIIVKNNVKLDISIIGLNGNKLIYSKEYKRYIWTGKHIKGFTIYAKKNSSAHKYAKKHKIKFKTIK